MDEAPKLPEITDQQLAQFRRCRFVHRVFHPTDCYKSLEPIEDLNAYLEEYGERGDQMFDDPERFEVLEGGWDHEHCDVCCAKVMDGDWYWPNEDEDAGKVDLCEACYRRVLRLLHGV
jgi:hypothetical protein